MKLISPASFRVEAIPATGITFQPSARKLLYQPLSIPEQSILDAIHTHAAEDLLDFLTPEQVLEKSRTKLSLSRIRDRINYLRERVDEIEAIWVSGKLLVRARLRNARKAPNGTRLEWRGMPLQALASDCSFQTHGTLTLSHFLRSPLKTVPLLETCDYLDPRDITALLQLYLVLRQQARRINTQTLLSIPNLPIFGDTLFHNPERLDLGFRWLDLQGIPIRRVLNDYAVLGLASRHFYTLDLGSWSNRQQGRWIRNRLGATPEEAIEYLQRPDFFGNSLPMATRLSDSLEFNYMPETLLQRKTVGMKQLLMSENGKGRSTEAIRTLLHWTEDTGTEPVQYETGWPRTELRMAASRMHSTLSRGAFLRVLRHIAGLTLAELGRLTGLDPHVLTYLEEGGKLHHYEPWSIIALALDTTVEEIRGDEAVQDLATHYNAQHIMMNHASAQKEKIPKFTVPKLADFRPIDVKGDPPNASHPSEYIQVSGIGWTFSKRPPQVPAFDLDFAAVIQPKRFGHWSDHHITTLLQKFATYGLEDLQEIEALDVIPSEALHDIAQIFRQLTITSLDGLEHAIRQAYPDAEDLCELFHQLLEAIESYAELKGNDFSHASEEAA